MGSLIIFGVIGVACIAVLTVVVILVAASDTAESGGDAFEDWFSGPRAPELPEQEAIAMWSGPPVAGIAPAPAATDATLDEAVQPVR